MRKHRRETEARPTKPLAALVPSPGQRHCLPREIDFPRGRRREKVPPQYPVAASLLRDAPRGGGVYKRFVRR